MSGSHYHQVGVISTEAPDGYRRLFSLLAEVFDLSIIPMQMNDSWSNYDAVICLGVPLPQTAPQNCRCYWAPKSAKVGARKGVHLNFEESFVLPKFLRGRSIVCSDDVCTFETQDFADSEVVATIDGQPIWIVARNPSAMHYAVAVPLPQISASEQLVDYLNDKRFISLLPLYHFLSQLSGAKAHPFGEFRASVIIDDPNLHRPTYGRIHYRSLLSQAHELNFHIAMATVPLDGWYVNADVADLFRQNPQRLSLLVHGCNHTNQELARVSNRQSATEVVARAVYLVDRMERSARLSVLRVMVPPHGACSEVVMRELFRHGFHALTTTLPWLWKFNPVFRNQATVGLKSAEIHAGGLPVVGRFRFSSPTIETKVLLAAYFGQPIVLYGHHDDLDSKTAGLHRAVEFVNSLGGVRWLDMDEICKTNYHIAVIGTELRVWLCSREAEIRIPDGVETMTVKLSDALLALPRTDDQRSIPNVDVATRLECISQSKDKRELFQLLMSIDSRPLEPIPSGASILLGAASRIRILVVTCLEDPPSGGVRIHLNPLHIIRRIAAEIRDRTFFHLRR